ncbi:MAG: hypothetical protein KF832_17845 [Caldilineaceae bacterium]|nr:hypothetical protein [Caldilineaceae bacterium]
MRTINLQTVYHLVITSLLLGACLGLLSQHLPALLNQQLSTFEQPVLAAPVADVRTVWADKSPSARWGQTTTFAKEAVAPVALAGKFSVANLRLAPVSTVLPTQPTDTGARPTFALAEQKRFEERITPRLFLYIHAGTEGVAGYTVQVRKDGHLLPVTKMSKGGLPNYTWPQPHARQRYTNLKLEFPDIQPDGLWEVQLFDSQGIPVGPRATFHLQADETHQEMYLAYQQQ